MPRPMYNKLSLEQVEALRARYANSPAELSFETLAQEYGVSVFTINAALRGNLNGWNDEKFPGDMVIAVRQAYKRGDSYKKIKADFGINNKDVLFLCIEGCPHIDQFESRCTYRKSDRRANRASSTTS